MSLCYAFLEFLSRVATVSACNILSLYCVEYIKHYLRKELRRLDSEILHRRTRSANEVSTKNVEVKKTEENGTELK